MAEQTGKFLTELPELTTPIEDDLMYIVDDDTSKRITLKNLKSVVGGEDVTGTVEGASVSFSDGADGIPMKECEVTLTPTQDLHGYSKPWAGGAGKNKAEGRYQWNINASGGILTRPEYATCVIAVTQDQTYTFSVDGVATIIDVIAFYTTYPTIGSQSYNSTRTTGANATFTAPITGYAVIRKDYDIGNMQVEEGSQATAYEPYSNICPISGHTDVTITVVSTSGGSGDDTTVSFGRTVYGGTLDVTTGELTVTHAIVNLGSLSWTRTTDYTNPIFYAQITDKMNSSIDSICEWYANGGLITGPTTINALQNGYFGCGNNSKYIYVRDDQYTSVSDFTSATASVKFYYELATPQTFNLTPTQVETLLGQNYVSHDGGGNIKVVYIRDLDIVINDLINRVTALENE